MRKSCKRRHLDVAQLAVARGDFSAVIILVGPVERIFFYSGQHPSYTEAPTSCQVVRTCYPIVAVSWSYEKLCTELKAYPTQTSVPTLHLLFVGARLPLARHAMCTCRPLLLQYNRQIQSGERVGLGRVSTGSHRKTARAILEQ